MSSPDIAQAISDIRVSSAELKAANDVKKTIDGHIK